MNQKLNRLIQPSVALYFLVMVVFAVVTAFWPWNRIVLAVCEGAGIALLFLFFHMKESRRRKAIASLLQIPASSLGETVNNEMPFPAALIQLEDGKIIWRNQEFDQITGAKPSILNQHIRDFVPELDTQWIGSGKLSVPKEVKVDTRRYRVLGSPIRDAHGNGQLGVFYFVDTTELLHIKDEYIRSRPIVSIILIDNYAELTGKLSDAAISTLNASINNCLTEWTDQVGGLLRKLERNRYLFITEAGNFPKVVEGRFAILDSIRHVTNSAGVGATISMGMGKDGVNLQENYSFASLSLEMALSRGGDQAVMKDRYDFSFYGGRNQETASRTTVKSRVMASTLCELISQSSQVYIMGHKNADLDAVGAAVGVSRICRKKGKDPKIVLDLEHNAAKSLIAKLQAVPQYAGCFISDQEALIEADAQSLLIVVDTNRPNQVESKALLESVSRVCVIDHHRRAADYIQNPVLLVHEPSASSASELVAELLQYAVEPDDILPVETKALLAGIALDTKNFSVRTSERTFEAAAFLRRLGADTVEVKKLFKNDLSSTLTRYQIIQAARLYHKDIAIAALDYTINRIVAAQAADEMLNITGIETSFVLFPQDQCIIISARSIGDANVQMILEPLGGGGNSATAGAQIPDVTLRQALSELVASIDKYYKE